MRIWCEPEGCGLCAIFVGTTFRGDSASSVKPAFSSSLVSNSRWWARIQTCSSSFHLTMPIPVLPLSMGHLQSRGITMSHSVTMGPVPATGGLSPEVIKMWSTLLEMACEKNPLLETAAHYQLSFVHLLSELLHFLVHCKTGTTFTTPKRHNPKTTHNNHKKKYTHTNTHILEVTFLVL